MIAARICKVFGPAGPSECEISLFFVHNLDVSHSRRNSGVRPPENLRANNRLAKANSVNSCANPKEADARRYAEAGLVYCKNATLEQMLAVIDLAAHGLYYPFILDAYRSGYNVVVNPMPNPSLRRVHPGAVSRRR